MERIKIENVLLAAAEFLNEPGNKEKEEAFEEMKRKTIIKAFLPIQAKIKVLQKILIDMSLFPNEIYDFPGIFEICTTFDGILAYTNVDLNVKEDFKDYEYYDILWASGYCDYILEFCERDYKRMIDMAWQMINYNNLNNLTQMMNRIDTKTIADLNLSLEKFKMEINADTIHDIANIVSANDSTLNEIKNTIEESAYEAISSEE